METCCRRRSGQNADIPTERERVASDDVIISKLSRKHGEISGNYAVAAAAGEMCDMVMRQHFE